MRFRRLGAASALIAVGLVVGLSAPSIQSVLAAPADSSTEIVDAWATDDGHAVIEFADDGESPEVVTIAQDGAIMQSAWVHRGQSEIVLDLVSEDTVTVRNWTGGGETEVPTDMFEDEPETDRKPLSAGQYRVIAWADDEQVGETTLNITREAASNITA